MLMQSVVGQVHNPFLNSIHYAPEPTVAGFPCGTTQHSVAIVGQTTVDDIAFTPANPTWEPLVVEIDITGFVFSDLVVAANNLSTATYFDGFNTWSSHATYFDWAFDPLDSTIINGTQNQVLPGTGLNPLFPNPNASGHLYTNLFVPAASPDGTILGVEYTLDVPSYYISNSTPDDYVSSFTQVTCIPEPGSTMLFALSSFALLIRRNRS